MSKKSKTSKSSSVPSVVNTMVSAERVQAYIRSRFNPIRSLTPELLSQYLDAFKTGYLRQCALIWDTIEERDDTLSSVIPKRNAAPGRHGWEILTLDSIADSLKAEAAEHKAALEAFYNNLTVTNAIDENEKGEVSLLLRQMMDAVGKRYAVHEIVWRPLDQGAEVRPSEISDQSDSPNTEHRTLLTADLRFVPLWFFENTKGKLRYFQSEGALEGVEMDEDSWLISVGQGLMTACSVAYIYKTMSLKDWVIYNERHGMPGIHGKTDAAKDSDEWDTLVTAVQNFAADWAMVTNSGASIDKIDMSTTGQLPYPPLVERMDRALAALWRGADLSTISGGTSQAGQGASLQGDESKILEEDDARWLSETLSRQLDRRVIEYIFGEGVQPLAYIKIKTAQKKDTALDLQIDQFLLGAGAPIGVKSALERYNRPMPATDEQLLSSTILQAVPANPPGQKTSGDTGSPATAVRPATAGNRPGVKTGTPTAPPGSAGSLSIANSDSQSSRRSPEAKPDHPAIGRLLATARMELAAAQEQVLQPLRARLEAIMQLPDPEVEPALRRLQSDLPALLKTINANPETAKVIEDTLSAALLSGLTENPQSEIRNRTEALTSER